MTAADDRGEDVRVAVLGTGSAARLALGGDQ